jgi:nitrile hydratase beta subunit
MSTSPQASGSPGSPSAGPATPAAPAAPLGHITHADLGGRNLPGVIVPEPEGELFHAAWEPRAFALTLAMGATGCWNLDASRASRESLPDYPRSGYYRIWVAALERLLRERGLITHQELESGRALVPAPAVPRVLKAADVPAVLAAGSPTERPVPRPASFTAGQRVRTGCGPFNHHVRLTAYLQGKVGAIVRVHGAHVYPDTHAHGRGEEPQWLYSVAFTGEEVWGAAAEPGLLLHFDAFEPYLQAA